MTRLAAAARRHWGLGLVGALALLVGALVLDDYGIWADTWSQRAIGNAALDYLAGDGERAFGQLYFPWDRYYGAVFEAPLVLAERILGLEHGRDVALSRRLLTHLFFLTGGVFCYLLVLRLFNSRALALIATVLFLLHPRIYAHSFFNSKDVPFLAMFMISLYLVHRAFRRDTLGAFVLCGVGVGLLVNLRIMGIVLFAAVLALRALDLALAGSADERRRMLLTGGAFALAATLTLHASLPTLWADPAGQFGELARTLNAHPNPVYRLFRGEWLYSRGQLPFDYVPVWVGITTPPATLLLAFVGTAALAWRGLRRPRAAIRNGPLRFGLLLVALPAATVAAVAVLGSNLYDHWRQLFFLYAPLVLLAIMGIHWLASATRGAWPGRGAYALTGLAVATALVSMVRIHPHQDSYFTFLTDRTTLEHPSARYDLRPRNYQGVVFLARILDDHPSGNLFVSLASPFFGSQRHLFPPDERERLVETRDFRSGERNFLELPNPEVCPLASAPPSAIVRADRLYANTLHCMVDPVDWLGERRREAQAAEPLLRSVYDIHRDGRLLTYLRDGCPREDVEARGPRLFLHVLPLNAGDLPPWGRERGFENLDRVLRGGTARIDGDCVGVVLLPDYPIAAVRTGQITDEGVLWEAEIAFAEEAPDYAAARRDALAKEPLARSVYALHLDGRELTYVRDGCTDEEAEARFFLHVVPADAGDLPPHRKEHGFDNLDFTLATRGARLDGNCVAVARLPDYPIATVRTGQYDDAGALWTAEFALPDGE